MHDPAGGEPLEQRVDVAQMGRRLLAHHRPAHEVRVSPQQGGHQAALGTLGGEQPLLQLGRRDLADQPAPERAYLAPSRVVLVLAAVQEVDDAPDRLVVAQVAQPSQLVARALAANDVPNEMVLWSDGDALGCLEHLAQQRRAAAADADDEDCLGLGRGLGCQLRRDFRRRPPSPALRARRGYHSPPSNSAPSKPEELAILFGRGRGSSVPLLARNEVRLFLTSFVILYVELLLIRWIPANVKYIGFFSNFLLIASFLGIGLGILLGRNGASPRLSPFAFLLAGVVALVGQLQLNIQVQSTDEIFFGLAENRAADINFLFLPLVVGLVVALLATLALPLGPLLKSMWPLKAYAIDIVGSMSGIAAFAVLSALGTEPVVWFGVAFALFAAVELGRSRLGWALVNSAVLGVVVVLVLSQARPNEIWSPYYRIDSFRDRTGLEHITVDGIPHQALHPVGREGIEEFYNQLYEWFPGRTFERVLIVGAGSGSDAAIALSRGGAQSIDAVEIDPALMQIGIERHPNRPYDDPRVHRHINDGRAYLRTLPAGTTYDLVIFALPDSLTLVSSQGAIRLESFLFTEEAFAAVSEHLDPADGIFVLYNYYRDPWLVAKISDMLETTFGHAPLLRTYAAHKATLAAGPLVASLPGGQPPADGVDQLPQIGAPEPVAATDDWPFLYLRTPHIPQHYLAALAIVLLGALLAVAGAARLTGTTIRRFSPHFFVLGVAFLLLTTRSLVSFSLLFGTTWVVNAMAFFAILASVLLAIFVNARWPIRRPTPFYVLLFASIALAFLLPPESLLIDPPWLRYGLAAAVAFAPVFFANLVFSYSFRDTTSADMAFASNLLGAMIGGAIEYLALISGYGSLLLVVALLYGLAWLFATRLRLLNDVELARDSEAVTAPAPAPTSIPPEPAT